MERSIKEKVMKGVALATIIATGALFAACSTGSGTSDEVAATTTTTPAATTTTTPATTPATTTNNPTTTSTTTTTTNPGTGQPSEDTDITPLIGTWKAVDVDIEGETTFTDTTTITISASGDYTRMCVSIELLSDSSKNIVSYACMGTVTRAGSTMTTHITKELETDDELTSFPTSGWTNTTASDTKSFYIRNGVLYNVNYTRQGSGDSIIGTWSGNSTHTESELGSLFVEDSTSTFTIGTNTIHKTTHTVSYPKGYPSLASEDDSTWDYTYVVKDANTITVTKTSNGESSDWKYILDGNTIILLADPGTELIKQ